MNTDRLDANGWVSYGAVMSKKLDGFPGRLKLAAARQKVAYTPQSIGTLLGMDRRKVDVWMTQGSTPRAELLFEVADKLGVEARWLATGEGPMVRLPTAAAELEPHEQQLVTRYRDADPRWQLSMRLLSYIATEDQVEVAGDVNMVIARVFGKKPRDIKYIPNERVREAFGDAPHISGRAVHEPPPKSAFTHRKKRAAQNG